MTDGTREAGDRQRSDHRTPADHERGLAGMATALRLHPRRWDGIEADSPAKGLATVVGGWALLAFGRFGLQGLTAPRVLTRFVLVGVYGWLLMAALVWLIGRLARRGRSGLPTPGPTRSLQFTGLAHQPIVVLGVLLLFGQVLQVQWPLTVAATLTLGLWLPGLLVASLASAFGRFDRWSLAAAALATLAWTGLAGRYLLDRVGHLF